MACFPQICLLVLAHITIYKKLIIIDNIKGLTMQCLGVPFSITKFLDVSYLSSLEYSLQEIPYPFMYLSFYCSFLPIPHTALSHHHNAYHSFIKPLCTAFWGSLNE